MTKREIPKAKDNELIVDLVNTYANLCVNINSPSWESRGVKRYSSHCDDLLQEMGKRGLLTKEDVDYLNK